MMDKVKELTAHAIENKILVMRSGDIEMHFHPSAFVPESALGIEKVEELTDEERLIADKKQLDDDLFYST